MEATQPEGPKIPGTDNQRQLVSQAARYGLSRDELVQCTHLPNALDYAEKAKLTTVLGRLLALVCEHKPSDVEQFLIDELKKSQETGRAPNCIAEEDVEDLAEIIVSRWSCCKSEDDTLVAGPFVKEGLLCLGCSETEAVLHARDCLPSEVKEILMAGRERWNV